MKKLIIITSVLFTILITGGFIANYFLNSMFGMSLFDILSFILSSSNTNEANVVTLDSVKSEMGLETYNELLDNQNDLIELFNISKSGIDEINENVNFTKLLNESLSDNYSMYLLITSNFNNQILKIFDYTIKVDNGNIIYFDEGNNFKDYSMIVEMDNSLFVRLLNGEIDETSIQTFVKEKQLKINPITEITKLINIIPKLMDLINSN